MEMIKVSKDGKVGLIELNRPDALNALNSQVAREVIEAAQAFDKAQDVGCIVVTGSKKAFAAGADIAEMANKSAKEMAEKQFFAEWDEFVAVQTPKIAAVNGYALGGGCELMMMCDFAIAGESAKFGQPEIKLGVIAGMGGTQRMTKLIGRSKSMDMHLTGRMLDAAEALQSGLVARVVSDEDVVPEAMSAAKTIAGYSRLSLKRIRGMVMGAEELPLAEGVLKERETFYALFDTDDQKEGMAAFLEKREPKFQ